MLKQSPEVIANLIQFIKQFPTKKLEKGQVFLSPLQKPKEMYVSLDGYTQYYSITKTAKKVSLGYIKPVNFFPLPALLEGHTTRYYYKAIDDMTIYKIPVAKFEEICLKDQQILILLSYGLMERFLWTLERLAKSLELNAYGKVCSNLLLLAEMGAKETDKGLEILTRMSQDELATFSGLTRESLNMQITKLVKGKLIKYEKKTVTLLDPGRLREIIE
jgi:CRP/FNR family transcriptional regulator, cyclic AMP receptor protein